MKVKFNLRFLAVMLCGIFATLSAMAQDITVKGTVNDAFGDPVMGATVLQVGTTNGCVTDLDGNFSLKAPEGAILRFSFIGYRAQEHPAAANMTVTLEEDSEMLEDVVVIGYGVARKNDLTGSVTAIKPDEKNKGLVTNAQDMISGKIAGVNITSAGGTPGAGSTIRIRGGSSLSSSNDPLIVIDGLAMDNAGVKGLSNPLSMVNPADIESFTVLKDASATAIYGSRGSNGVIIITTKKGLRGQAPRVSYNGNVSVSKVINTVDVMNGEEFRAYVEKFFPDAESDPRLALGYLDEKGQRQYANTNWQDQIYRVAVSTDHNVTISGGLKNMPYRATVGYTKQNGVIKTSDFERYTASFNVSPSLFDDHLKFNINGKGMIAKSNYADTGAIGSAIWMDPTKPVYSSRDEYKNFAGYWQWTKPGNFGDSTWPLMHDTNTTHNPVSQLNTRSDKATSKSFIGNAEITYNVHGIDGLNVHANFAGDFSTGKQNTDIDPSSPTNTYYGNYNWEEINKYNLTFNMYAQYMKDFNDANHFDIMAGYEYQKVHAEQTFENYGLVPFTNPMFEGWTQDKWNNATLDQKAYKYNTRTQKYENYLVSFFGRANYSLLDRYMLTATVRYDGTSRFKDHWALFPSFAFGWRMKDEAFLKDVDAVSEAKLRLGYGQTGQQALGDGFDNMLRNYYYWIPTYTNSVNTGSNYPLVDNAETISKPEAYNTTLKWETTTTYNVGLDLGFLNDRIVANVDYYYRKTTDLLNYTSAAAGTSFKNYIWRNVGDLDNQGVEVALTWRAIQKDDLNVEVSINGAYNKNEVTGLVADTDDYYIPTGGISAGTGINCQAHAVGHPINSFFVYQQVYDEAGKPIEGVYVDRNADGKINESDKYFYKSPAAPFTGGFSLKVNYKNWDFGTSFRGSFGNYVYYDQLAGASNCDANEVYNSFGALSNRPKEAAELGWHSYDNVLSDFFVRNASFIKCDNITVGYSFDSLCGTKINGRVFGTVSNVFTITKYDGLDPEVPNGIDNNIYPRPFSGLVGVSLNF